MVLLATGYVCAFFAVACAIVLADTLRLVGTSDGHRLPRWRWSAHLLFWSCITGIALFPLDALCALAKWTASSVEQTLFALVILLSSLLIIGLIAEINLERSERKHNRALLARIEAQGPQAIRAWEFTIPPGCMQGQPVSPGDSLRLD